MKDSLQYAENVREAEEARMTLRADSKEGVKVAIGVPDSHTAEIWSLYLEEAEEREKKRTARHTGSRGASGGGGGPRDDESLDPEFRSDAEIWSLYLEDTRREANARAELWKTGLDSLLIFAGLFAGVVSSFVIDIKGDLDPDAEPRLLNGILNFESGADHDIPIKHISVVVNSLWSASLCITLSSAVMGVSARIWISKFVPPTTRREASDAYARYKLDCLAERWYLDAVITSIPLLVQLGLSLFLIGLVIQHYDLNPTLGKSLLSVFIAGFALYFVMTIMPWIKKSSPFSSPLTDPLKWFFDRLAGRKQRSTAYKPHMNEAEALREIFLYIINSGKPSHVDEAIAEIALPSSTDKQKWIPYLCENGAPEAILSRFRYWGATGASTADERNKHLRNQLMAFKIFADYYEGQQLAHQKPAPGPETVWQRSLRPDNLLGRWNTLYEPLRPLLFSVRTHAMCILESIDFHPGELQERPWEMVYKDHSDSRFQFMLAACHGTIQSRPNLRSVSRFIIGLSMAKAAIDNHTGHATEWAGTIDHKQREEVETYLLQYLSKLCSVTLEGWNTMFLTAFHEFPSALQAKDKLGAATLLPLSHSSHALRINIIKILEHMSVADSKNFRIGAYHWLTALADIVVQDELGPENSELGLLAGTIRGNSDRNMRKWIANHLVAVTHATKDKVRLCAILLLASIQYPTTPVMKRATQILIDAALNANSAETRHSAMKLAQTVDGVLKKTFLVSLTSGLTSRDVNKRLKVLTALRRAFLRDESDSFTFPWRGDWKTLTEEVINKLLRHIIRIAIDDTADAPATALIAQELLTEFVQAARINQWLDLNPRIWLQGFAPQMNPGHIHFSQAENMRVQSALLVLETVSYHPQFSLDQSPELLNLVQILCQSPDTDLFEVESRTSNLIMASIRVIAWLYQSGKLTDEHINVLVITPTKPAFNALTGTQWISLLSSMAEQGSFPDAIPKVLETLFEGDVFDYRRRSMVFGLLESCQFAGDPNYEEAFERAIPDLAGALNPHFDNDGRGWKPSFRKMNWIQLLAEASGAPGLQRIVSRVLGGVARDVKDFIGDPWNPEPLIMGPDENEYLAKSKLSPRLRQKLYRLEKIARMTWLDIVATIARYAPQEFLDTPAIFLQIVINDPDENMREACLNYLLPFARENKTKIIDDMNIIIVDSDWRVRRALINLLDVLGESENLPDIVLTTLKRVTMSDSDSAVRSGALNCLSDLARKDQDRHRDSIAEMVLEDFAYGIGDESPTVRQTWLKFVCAYHQTAHAGFLWLPRLFDLAVKDTEPGVYSVAAELLQLILEDTKSNNTAASTLSHCFESALKNPDLFGRAITLLAAITTPKAGATNQPGASLETFLDLSRQLDDSIFSDSFDNIAFKQTGHNAWVYIIVLLTHLNKIVLASPIEMVLKKLPADAYTFSKLLDLFQNVNLPDPIQIILPRSLVSALKDNGNHKARSAALDVLTEMTLSSYINRTLYSNLIGWDKTENGQLTPQLVDMCIKDEDPAFRSSALALLISQMTYRRLAPYTDPDSVKATLGNILGSSLIDAEVQIRIRAVEVLQNLPDEFMTSLVFTFVPQLLMIMLRDPDVSVRQTVQYLLFNRLQRFSTREKLTKDMVSAISFMLAMDLEGGKYVVLQVIEFLQISDHIIPLLARAVSPLLKTPSPTTQATAIELLSRLYEKYPYPRSVKLVVSDIVGLALAMDYSDDALDLRVDAIRLLVRLISHCKDVSDTEAKADSLSVLEQLTPFLPTFLSLLEVEYLNPSLMDLLSIMSSKPSIRRTITLYIMDAAFQDENPSLNHRITLLGRLITDERFEFTDEPTDYVMAFFASALVMKSQFSPYRFEILAALRRCCGPSKVVIDITQGRRYRYLVDCFALALFGKHAREAEVKTWVSQWERWQQGTLRSLRRDGPG